MSVQSDLSGKMNLSADFMQRPVLFSWGKEIDAQAGDNPTAMLVLLPIKSERIKVIVLEIHHGEECIVNAFFQPALCILVYRFVSVPTQGRISVGVLEFPNGRTADLYPRFALLGFLIQSSGDGGDVVSSPLLQILAFSVFAESILVRETIGILRIADVVKMNAVYVVTVHYFCYDTCQIISGSWVTWIQIPGTLVLLAKFPVLLNDGMLAQ